MAGFNPDTATGYYDTSSEQSTPAPTGPPVSVPVQTKSSGFNPDNAVGYYQAPYKQLDPTSDKDFDPGTLQFATPWKTYDTGFGLSKKWENRFAGAGQAVEEQIQGVHQKFDHIFNTSGKDALDSEINNEKQTDNQGLNQNSQAKLGNFAMRGAESFAIPGSTLAQIGGNAALSSLDSQDSNNVGLGSLEDALGGAVGGAAGVGIGKIASKLIRPVAAGTDALTGQMDTEAKQAADLLRSKGISVDSAQYTQNDFLLALKRWLKDTGLGSNKVNQQDKKQAAQGTKYVLEKMGLPNTTKATQPAMNSVYTNAADTINDIYARTNINMFNPAQMTVERTVPGLNRASPQTGTMLDHLSDISKMAQTNIPGDHGADALTDIIGGVNSRASMLDQYNAQGFIPNDVMQKARQALSGLYSQGGSMRQYAGYAAEVLDQAVAHQGSPLDGATLKAMNDRLGLYHDVVKAIKSDDTIDLPTLNRVMDSGKNLDQSVRGFTSPLKQDVYETSQAAAKILPDKMPQSGTTPRLLGILGRTAGTDALLGSALGLAQGDNDRVKDSLLYGGAMMAGGAAGRSALFSKVLAPYIKHQAYSKVAAYAAEKAMQTGAGTGAGVSQLLGKSLTGDNKNE